MKPEKTNSDYIYRNEKDSERVRIFKVYSEICWDNNKISFLGWDIDFYSKNTKGYQFTYCQSGACDFFKTLGDAKKQAELDIGILISINPNPIIEGWKF